MNGKSLFKKLKCLIKITKRYCCIRNSTNANLNMCQCNILTNKEKKNFTASIACLENPMDRGAWQAIQTTGSQRVGQDWSNLAHKHASASPRRNNKGSLKGKLYMQILNTYENLKYLEIFYPKIVLFLFLEKGTKIHPVCLRTVIQYGRLNLGPSQKYLQFSPGKSDQTLLSLSQVIMKHLN